jgi:hypothetical protein
LFYLFTLDLCHLLIHTVGSLTLCNFSTPYFSPGGHFQLVIVSNQVTSQTAAQKRKENSRNVQLSRTRPHTREEEIAERVKRKGSDIMTKE